MKGYKYRNFEGPYDSTELLKNNELYAALIKDLNDVQEATFTDHLPTEIDWLSSASGLDATHIKKSWSDLKNKIETLGIYSLSSTPFNTSMWGLYSNKSSGFCIEYDIKKLMDSVRFLSNVSMLKVEYTESPPIITWTDLFERSIMLTKLLGTKHQDWSQENEIRLVYETSGIKTYHPSALAAVYMGTQISDKNKEKLLSALQNKDVDVYQMTRESHSYKIKPELVHQIRHHIENPLPSDSYEILQTDHNHTVENFFVLYKGTLTDNATLSKFIKKFREMHATKPSNVYLFSHRINKDLYTKYPRNYEEDKLFEKYLIGQSFFDYGDDVC